MMRGHIVEWLDDAVYNQDGTLGHPDSDRFNDLCQPIRECQDTITEGLHSPCGMCENCLDGINEDLMYTDPVDLRPGYVSPG